MSVMNFILNSKENRCLVYKNGLYSFDKTHNGISYWNCNMRAKRCSARVHTDKNENFVRYVVQHYHINEKADFMARELMSDMVQLAKEHPETKLRKIIQGERPI